MKKSELKKIIKETILQEGLPRPIGDLQELSSWLSSLDKAEWNQITDSAEKNPAWSKKMYKAVNEVMNLLSEVN